MTTSFTSPLSFLMVLLTLLSATPAAGAAGHVVDMCPQTTSTFPMVVTVTPDTTLQYIGCSKDGYDIEFHFADPVPGYRAAIVFDEFTMQGGSIVFLSAAGNLHDRAENVDITVRSSTFTDVDRVFAAKASLDATSFHLSLLDSTITAKDDAVAIVATKQAHDSSIVVDNTTIVVTGGQYVASVHANVATNVTLRAINNSTIIKQGSIRHENAGVLSFFAQETGIHKSMILRVRHCTILVEESKLIVRGASSGAAAAGIGFSTPKSDVTDSHLIISETNFSAVLTGSEHYIEVEAEGDGVAILGAAIAAQQKRAMYQVSYCHFNARLRDGAQLRSSGYRARAILGFAAISLQHDFFMNIVISSMFLDASGPGTSITTSLHPSRAYDGVAVAVVGIAGVSATNGRAELGVYQDVEISAELSNGASIFATDGTALAAIGIALSSASTSTKLTVPSGLLIRFTGDGGRVTAIDKLQPTVAAVGIALYTTSVMASTTAALVNTTIEMLGRNNHVTAVGQKFVAGVGVVGEATVIGTGNTIAWHNHIECHNNISVSTSSHALTTARLSYYPLFSSGIVDVRASSCLEISTVTDTITLSDELTSSVSLTSTLLGATMTRSTADDDGSQPPTTTTAAPHPATATPAPTRKKTATHTKSGKSMTSTVTGTLTATLAITANFDHTPSADPPPPSHHPSGIPDTRHPSASPPAITDASTIQTALPPPPTTITSAPTDTAPSSTTAAPNTTTSTGAPPSSTGTPATPTAVSIEPTVHTILPPPATTDAPSTNTPSPPVVLPTALPSDVPPVIPTATPIAQTSSPGTDNSGLNGGAALDNGDDDSDPNVLPILGVIAGALLLCCCILFAFMWVRRRRLTLELGEAPELRELFIPKRNNRQYIAEGADDEMLSRTSARRHQMTDANRSLSSTRSAASPTGTRSGGSVGGDVEINAGSLLTVPAYNPSPTGTDDDAMSSLSAGGASSTVTAAHNPHHYNPLDF